MKRIADDFGFGEGIDQAIYVLAKAGLIEGTSCMSGGFTFECNAALLKDVQQTHTRFEVGLHLTLSEALLSPLSSIRTVYPSLKTWLVKSQLGSVDKQFVRAELEIQWERFTACFGCEPDYLDGHQHVHLLHGVRSVIFEFLKEKNFKGWVRNCGLSKQYNSDLPAKVKLSFLTCLSKPFAKECDQLALKRNQNFYGVYGFETGIFEKAWPLWLKKAHEGDVIMLHPAHYDFPPLVGDPISKARIEEFRFLMQNQEDFLKINQL